MIVAAEKPSLRDLAWAAGFLEGEGSFKINGNKNPSQQVSAAQVQREPLERLLKMFGGHITNSHEKRSDRQDIHKWGISGSRARGVILTLFSFMSPRRKEQIRKALNPNASTKGL